MHSKNILTLREGRKDGWHVLHENDEEQLAHHVHPWAVVFFRDGKLKRVAGRFIDMDDAENTLAEWEYDDQAYRDDSPSLPSPWWGHR